MKGNANKSSDIPPLTAEEEAIIESLELPELGSISPLPETGNCPRREPRKRIVAEPFESSLNLTPEDEALLLQNAEELLLRELMNDDLAPCFETIEVPDNEEALPNITFPGKQKKGIRFLRRHSTMDGRLTWWHSPGEGEVLIFDPHGMTVHQIRKAFAEIRVIGKGRIVYIIHGGDGTNPLGQEVEFTFPRISKILGNPGVTRVDLR